MPLPEAPAGAVVFDPEFLDQIQIPVHLRNFLLPIQPPKFSPVKAIDPFERDFAVFLDIYKFFYAYVQSFMQLREQQYANLEDFRQYYVKRINEKFPYLYIQAETFQTTVDVQSIIVRTQGGGVGLRVELHPSKDGKFTAAFLPLYGEERIFSPQGLPLPGGTDFIIRTSTAVAYSQKLTPSIEPGVQVMFQPQILDLSQFRIYAEASIRFRVINAKKTNDRRLRLQELTLIPKVVYWQNTDRGGIYGDPIQELLGAVYYKLGSNLYGLMNLEFRLSL